jgi:hypothetical protein
LNESGGKFEGYLSTYGNKDLNGDICQKGCFDGMFDGIGAAKVPLLWNHNDAYVLGSMLLTRDETGLKMKGRFNLKTAEGRDKYELLKNGDINGFSMGYYVRDCKWDGDDTRILTDVDVVEGSFVTFPANHKATAEAKKRQANLNRLVKSLKNKEKKSIKELTSDESGALTDLIIELVDELKDGTVPEMFANALGWKTEEEPKEEEEKSDEEMLSEAISLLENIGLV